MNYLSWGSIDNAHGKVNRLDPLDAATCQMEEDVKKGRQLDGRMITSTSFYNFCVLKRSLQCFFRSINSTASDKHPVKKYSFKI